MIFKTIRSALLGLLIISSTHNGAFAQDNHLENKPAEIKCNLELQRCTYVTQNITGRQLVSRINAIMFPGSILTPNEGYINIESLKKINFWLNSTKLMTRFKALVPLLDSFEQFGPSALIQLTTEIYSVSEKGMANLEASIASTTDDTPQGSDVIFTNAGGVVNLAVKLGSKLLASVLGSKISREEISQVETVTQLIPNLSEVNYSHGGTVYVAPTPGIVKEEKAGLEINGTVSINKEDSELIVIENYQFKYGVINSSENNMNPVTILSINNPQLYLVKDTSSMVVSTHTVRETNGRTFGFGLFGRSRDKMRSKLMVITKARAYSFKEYVNELKRLRSMGLHREFSETEIQSFPAENIPTKKVLKSVIPYSFITPGGERILGFRLDKKLARNSNIKKSIEISIKGGGLKQSTILTTENLMLSGVKFDSLPLRSLDKDVIKFTIRLKPFRGKRTETVKLKLYYNPVTNQFIQE